ncbi:hypothetical protein SEEM038_05355, partial [Salmonella enterica subsp. enterica serovar Senftenberg str. NC_MB012510-0038]
RQPELREVAREAGIAPTSFTVIFAMSMNSV